MATTFGFLKDVRPYKASWRVQVKVLHAWRQYLESTGETLEIVFSDELDLVSKYVNELQVGEWVFIETFGLNYATGQYRPTQHLYKIENSNTLQRGQDSKPNNKCCFQRGFPKHKLTQILSVFAMYPLERSHVSNQFNQKEENDTAISEKGQSESYYLAILLKL